MKLYFLHRWKYLTSPLKVRQTIHRARSCRNTSAIFRQLLQPLPWYYTPDKPLTYEELQTTPDIIDARQFAIRDLIHMPLFRARDNSLCSLYRLYDDLCAHDLIMIGYECEYMFRRGSKRWLVSEIPDPQDSDPIRYAILASLAEKLAEAFNWKLELGIRRGGKPSDQSEQRATNFMREVAPSWTENIAGSEQRICLIDYKRETMAKPDPIFLKRNIEAGTGYIYTV